MLSAVHDRDVIHGDLTNNNVLVAADGSPRLADFGISNIMLLDLPEDQPIQCATKSSDIYALGGIMLQVLYGKQPYWWLKFNQGEPIDSSIEIQPNHLNFMRRCWSTARDDRPSVAEAIDYLQEALSNDTSSV
ncbi:kinase-like domain-containing protein [Suillus subaureus]|uniref:Kinase-like domain-containing protein n=1 Tax=Suillus subaureus TaxID=48587 RepID=A0A9P7ANL7_9AGAM|nr:kinase-like domain-containing protein [Suillus subaureus]KAG1791956.1 kinase-like domain-containing protein [Suillus subaureus]